MAGVFIRKVVIIAAAAATMVATPAAAQFKDGYSFLKAVRERDGDEATKLLNKPGGTLVNTSDQTTGETALDIVVRRRDETWTRFILERGADPNKADKRGATPLAIAAGNGFVEGVELLLSRGASVDVTDGTGETPLLAAVHRRDNAMVRLLLKHGADADRPDNSGRSARDYARLLGSASGVSAEIERAEAERKTSPSRDTYGPGL
jgi:ankyrin repeat protein